MAWFWSRFARLGAVAMREAMRPFVPVNQLMEAPVRAERSGLAGHRLDADVQDSAMLAAWHGGGYAASRLSLSG